MARRNQATFAKRQRESDKRAKQQAKSQKRADRRAERQELPAEPATILTVEDGGAAN